MTMGNRNQSEMTVTLILHCELISVFLYYMEVKEHSVMSTHVVNVCNMHS